MTETPIPMLNAPVHGPYGQRGMRTCALVFAGLVLLSLFAALLFPKSYALAVFGDSIQLLTVATSAVLALQNSRHSQSHARGFWLCVFVGTAMWFGSLLLWSVYELGMRQPVPDIPMADMLLFVKLVPFTAAVALGPNQTHDSRFRPFGFLDVAILMLYSLYLYMFFVYAYHLLPGGRAIYDFHFNVADAIGHQVFIVAAGLALLRNGGSWRALSWAYFLGAACYGLSSDLSNVAIDLGRYYTGGLYDVPLTASSAAFICVGILGRSIPTKESVPKSSEITEAAPRQSFAFLPSQLAMLVTLSVPLMGYWLLSCSMPPGLFNFRLQITLLTLFVLLLLLAIKEDLLTASLVSSYRRLSETYSSIDRLKSHLIQTEKLTTLGELVANVANQIKSAMARILDSASGLAGRATAESRTQSLSAKIVHYAQRTDALVQNMLRFAQETPLQITSLEINPLLESALQLSRISKLPNLRVHLKPETAPVLVRGDSSQLLHVFLQVIANAIDALEEVGGGELNITVRTTDTHIRIDFADSGPGIKQPEQVFEPFYTTKPVGKGTGLGLSTCYGILQQHGGEILCRNRPEGGAVFTIILPATTADAIVSSSTPPPVAEEAR